MGNHGGTIDAAVYGNNRDACIAGGLDRCCSGLGIDRIDDDQVDTLDEEVFDGRSLLGRVITGINDQQFGTQGLGLGGRSFRHRDKERIVQGRYREADFEGLGGRCGCFSSRAGGCGRGLGRGSGSLAGCAGAKTDDEGEHENDCEQFFHGTLSFFGFRLLVCLFGACL